MNRHPAATVLAATSALALLDPAGRQPVLQRPAPGRRPTAWRSSGPTPARPSGGPRSRSRRPTPSGSRPSGRRPRPSRPGRTPRPKKQEAERGVYALQLFKAAALGERDPQRALQLLDDRDRCPERLKDFTWRYVRGQCLVTEQVIGVQQGAGGIPPAARVDHSPDGSLVATVSGVDPHGPRLGRGRRSSSSYVLAGHRLAAHAVAFSPDGRTDRHGRRGQHRLRLGAAGQPAEDAAGPAGPAVHPDRAHEHGQRRRLHRRRPAAGQRPGRTGRSACGTWPRWPTASRARSRRPSGVLQGHAGPGPGPWPGPASRLYSGGSDGRVLEWQLTPGGGQGPGVVQARRSRCWPWPSPRTGSCSPRPGTPSRTRTSRSSSCSAR